MRNPNRRWSWRQAFRGATGNAASGVVSGAAAGALVPDPTGASIAVAVVAGALIGFLGSVASDTVSYIWDDEFISFASRPLYNFVVGLLLSMPFVLAVAILGRPPVEIYKFVGAMALLSSAISTSSARLIDDIRARRAYQRGPSPEWERP